MKVIGIGCAIITGIVVLGWLGLLWLNKDPGEPIDLALDVASVEAVGDAPTVVSAASILPDAIAMVCNLGPHFKLDRPYLIDQPRYQTDLDLVALVAWGLAFSYVNGRPWVGEYEALSVYFNSDRMMIGHDWFSSNRPFHRQHRIVVFSDRASSNDRTTLWGCADIANVDVSTIAGTQARWVQFLERTS